MAEKPKSRALLLLKAAVSLGLVAFIISRLRLEVLADLFTRTQPTLVLAAGALLAAQLLLSAVNIGFLLKHELKLPFHRLFAYYCFAWMAGLVSLGKLGEFSMSYYLKHAGVPYSKSLAILLVDKVVTLVVLVSAATLGTLWFFGLSNPVLLVFDGAVLAGVVALAAWFVSAEPPGARFVARIPRLGALLERRRENLATFRATFAEYFKHKRGALGWNAAGTLLRLLIMSLNGSVLFMALHSSIHPLYMMFIIAIAAIVALTPITLSGLGLVEVTYIYLASLVGIRAEVAIATELLTLTLNYSAALLITLIWVRSGVRRASRTLKKESLS